MHGTGAPVLQAVVGALPGPKQTVPRGELMALLRVLQLVDPVEGKVTIVGVDCAYVVDGFEAGQRHTMQGDNVDLWAQFWAEVDRHDSMVHVHKVPAHLKELDVLLGRVHLFDWVGNKLVDEIVSAMAEMLVPNYPLLLPHLKARDRKVRCIQEHLARFTQAAADLSAPDRRGMAGGSRRMMRWTSPASRSTAT